ncbi:hypothetical protein GCM10020295_17890 [Streptomyces cinereospinus]
MCAIKVPLWRTVSTTSSGSYAERSDDTCNPWARGHWADTAKRSVPVCRQPVRKVSATAARCTNCRGTVAVRVGVSARGRVYGMFLPTVSPEGSADGGHIHGAWAPEYEATGLFFNAITP